MFLALEPVVLFFAIWAALAWGVFFIQVAALPTVMRIVHGFTVTQSGLTYISLWYVLSSSMRAFHVTCRRGC